MGKKLRIPPYGRELGTRLQGNLARWWGAAPNGKAAPVFLLCGTDAWRIAREWQPHRLLVLCPPEESPSSFSWAILRGHDPVLLMRAGTVEGATVRALLGAVLHGGAERIIDITTMNRYARRSRAAA